MNANASSQPGVYFYVSHHGLETEMLSPLNGDFSHQQVDGVCREHLRTTFWKWRGMWWVGGKSHRTAVPQKHSLRDWSPSFPSTNISCSLSLDAEAFLSFPTLWPHPALHQVLRCQPPRLTWTHGGVSGCHKDCGVTLAFSRLPCSSFQTGQRGSGSLYVCGSIQGLFSGSVTSSSTSSVLSFLGFYPQAFCIMMAAWLIHSTQHFHIQDRKKMEGAAPQSRKSKAFLKPSTCVHSPKLCTKLPLLQSSLRQQVCLSGNLVLTVSW